ncbi:phosphatase PAP2 family protein [Hymenobacter sp. BT491]|nr:phosphatase PAP2 family protein [Hymenobacter sp. BT491]
MINAFDREILLFLNRFVEPLGEFNKTLDFIMYCKPLKGGVLMVLVWWLWFRRTEVSKVRVRQVLLATLVGSLLAMFSTRVLVNVMPERQRPIYNTELNMKIHPSLYNPGFKDVTSFPSDHATLFLALSTGFFFLSRRLGFAVLAYVLIVICLPRMYFGLHYPSDIVVGGLIGASAVTIANLAWVRRHLFQPLLQWSEPRPEFLYSVLFLLTYQITDMFESTRSILSFLFHRH